MADPLNESLYARFVRRHTTSNRTKILKRDQAACVWCSTSLTDATLTLDHVRPRSDGGSQWIGNLVAACVSCNGERGHTPWIEWLAECRMRGYTTQDGLHGRLTSRLSDPRSTRVGLMQSLGMSEAEIGQFMTARAERAPQQRDARARRRRARSRRKRA